MIRSRRSTTSTARLVHPSTMRCTVAEKKNPRNLRLAGNRSSQPPSTPRALVPQATSTSVTAVGRTTRRSARLATHRPPCLLRFGLATSPRWRTLHPARLAALRAKPPRPVLRPSRRSDPRRALRPSAAPSDRFRLAASPALRPASSRRSFRLLGATRNVSAALYPVNSAFLQVSAHNSRWETWNKE